MPKAANVNQVESNVDSEGALPASFSVKKDFFFGNDSKGESVYVFDICLKYVNYQRR